MWQRKKIRQVLGLSQLFNNVLYNAHTTRPLATLYRWGSGSGIWLWDSVSRGPIPNSKTAQYQTQRHWVLFILFIFCVKLHYSRCSPPDIIPNRPAKKRTHNSLNTKIPFFMAFFSYVKTYHNGLGRPPRHGFIKATFLIAENRVFDCHDDSIVERNYSVIDRQYETVWFCLAFNQQLSNNGHGEAKNQTNNPWFITEWFIHYKRKNILKCAFSPIS